MKKRRNLKGIEIISIQNPVAKYAHRFNKAQILGDKTKYSRKEKHTKQEVFPIALSDVLAKPLVSFFRYEIFTRHCEYELPRSDLSGHFFGNIAV